MSQSPIVPCLWFDDQAESAAQFYVECFSSGRITATSHYPEAIDNPSGKPRGSVLTVEFVVAGQRFTALNGGPQFAINPSISFFVHTGSTEDTDRLFGRLAEAGKVLMPLDSYPWSARYGWVQDRFGVSWQVMAGVPSSHGAVIVPCLMFADAREGQAEEAMKSYTRIFPGGAIDHVERYGPDRGTEGHVVHGRFVIAGQEMTAMDSHQPHGFTFNEGVSLQVMCEDQAAIDRYWAALSEGGEPGPCGWLKDRFGVSWQVVPDQISAWMTSSDAAARDRAFNAVMGMGKLDIAKLNAAFAGT